MYNSPLPDGYELKIDGVVVRRLSAPPTEDDRATYEELWHAFYAERQQDGDDPETYPPDRTPPPVRQLPEGGDEWFLILADADPVGGLAVGTYRDGDGEAQPRLQWIWVKPSRRRNGLAAGVLRALRGAYAPRHMWYAGPVSPKGEELLNRQDPGWQDRATGLDRDEPERRRRGDQVDGVG